MSQGQSEATRQRDYELPMLAGTDGKVAAAVLAATATAANIDLTTIPAMPAGFYSSNGKALNPNPLGHYVTLENDGANPVFVVFGPTQASVSGSNAPAAATTGTNVVGLCRQIPSGSAIRVKLPVGDMANAAGGGIGADSPCRWLAYVCAATQTATLRVYQSSL